MQLAFRLTMESNMKTLVAALTLLSLAGPAFAAGAYGPRFGYVPGYYGMNEFNRPQAPGEVNIPNPSGGIPGN
jgi:hypothetical protein